MSEDSAEDPKKIIVDEDWKSQIAEERARLKQQRNATGAAGEPSGPGAVPLPPASLPWLVTTIATQAMVALGQLPDPLEKKPLLNLDLAKHHIDMLAMIESKTRGNLDADEAHMLEQVLHQLRMAYVALRSRPATSAADTTDT